MLFAIDRAIVLFCLSVSVQCSQVKWLMRGDIITNENLASREIDLHTDQMYFPVSTIVDVTHETTNNRTITCIIACAVHMKGWVSIVEGGLKARKVRLRYVTENSEPDVFFVLLQSARREPLVIEDNIVRNSRYGIIYDPIRNWSQEDVQEISRDTDANIDTS